MHHIEIEQVKYQCRSVVLQISVPADLDPNSQISTVMDQFPGGVIVQLDAAVPQNGGVIGIGLVACNSDGLLVQHYITHPQLVAPELAEAIALRSAVQWAIGNGWLISWYRTDCTGVVKAFHKVDEDLSMLGTVLDDVKTLVSSFEVFCLSYIPRTLNVLAHNQARMALRG